MGKRKKGGDSGTSKSAGSNSSDSDSSKIDSSESDSDDSDEEEKVLDARKSIKTGLNTRFPKGAYATRVMPYSILKPYLGTNDSKCKEPVSVLATLRNDNKLSAILSTFADPHMIE